MSCSGIEEQSHSARPRHLGDYPLPDQVLRIRDVYPGSRILIFTHTGSRISDPVSKNSNARQGRKKNLLSYLFFGAINFTKLNYFIFEMLKKKILANFQIIIKLFTQKIVTKLSKIWVWDPVSKIRDPEKTYSGPGSRSRGQKGTGSRIRIRNTCLTDQELATRSLPSNFTTHSAGLAQYECGRIKPLLSLQQVIFRQLAVET